jgi:hypothetical protein
MEENTSMHLGYLIDGSQFNNKPKSCGCSSNVKQWKNYFVSLTMLAIAILLGTYICQSRQCPRPSLIQWMAFLFVCGYVMYFLKKDINKKKECNKGK